MLQTQTMKTMKTMKTVKPVKWQDVLQEREYLKQKLIEARAELQATQQQLIALRHTLIDKETALAIRRASQHH